MQRLLFTLALLINSNSLFAVVCFSIDLEEEISRGFSRSDVVFLAQVEGTAHNKPVLLSVEAVWKGSVSDKTSFHYDQWEPILFDDPFLVFAKAESDGIYSILGACLARELFAYLHRSGTSPAEFMVERFGEPTRPDWSESLAITYFGFFVILAILVSISIFVFKLVSPNKALKADA